MKGFIRSLMTTTAAAALGASFLMSPSAHADSRIKHVLLVSIDGFHAVDLENCVAGGTCPHLAELTKHGTTFPNASTTKPSDSFPGLLAQITGGTSKSTGIFYDDSYDRTLFASGTNCTVGHGDEHRRARRHGPARDRRRGARGAHGPQQWRRDQPQQPAGATGGGHCHPVWPHNLIHTNTIFGVLHAHQLQTAWSDKHAAYDIINGNAPSTQPANGPGTNVDDFFAPEINSDLSAANVQLIANLGLHSTAPNPATDPNCPGPLCKSDFTSTIAGVEYYDGIKVQAVLNEINGFDHTGKHHLGVPTILGMNFQSVSVGQKLAIGGYTDPVATPSANLANSIAFVDQSIGQMVGALHGQGLAESTLVIVSAKHGQSAIDRTKRTALDDGAVIATPIGANFAFDIGDDGVLIWLKDNTGNKTATAVHALDTFVGDNGIVEWLSGPLLEPPTRTPRMTRARRISSASPASA